MHILITGNLGYVGAALMPHLRQTRPGARLLGMDTGYFAHCLTDAARAPEMDLDVQYVADVRDVTVERLIGVDAVVHLAAVSNDPMGQAYEGVTRAINGDAAVAFARCAKQAGVGAFVFASSCSVYGVADDRPRTEASPVAPLTAYAKSKIAAEAGLCALADASFRVTCLRFATACGMSSRLRLDLVLNDFVASALVNRRIAVLSDGSPWRPLIDVGDMARAIDWAIDRPRQSGGDSLIVNVGSDAWNFQVRDLAQAVATAIPGTDVSINHQAPVDSRSYRVDFALFRSLAPHHQPAAHLDGTIAALANGLGRMKFADADFRRSPWMRLEVLAGLERQKWLDGELRWRRPTEARVVGAGQTAAVLA